MYRSIEKGTIAPDEGYWRAFRCEDNTTAEWLSSTAVSRGRMATCECANTIPVHVVVEGDWLEADGLAWINSKC